MRSTGIVKKINDREIVVAVYKESACSHCSKCDEKSKIVNEYIIYNKDNRLVNIGDKLVFEIDSKLALTTSFLFYIFPLILMILSYFLGMKFFLSDKIAIFFSFIGLIFSFIFLYFYDKIVGRKRVYSDINIVSIEKRGDVC